MEHTPEQPFFGSSLLFLTLSGVPTPPLQNLRIHPVLGFLAVGILLGPHAVGGWAQQVPWLSAFTFADLDAIQGYAELCIVFLMLLIGQELCVQLLWSIRRWVFIGRSAQVLLIAIFIGLSAWAFGNSVEASVILRLVLSLSSTAMVMQLLTQRNGLVTREGRSIFAVLMFQNFAVIPLLILMEILGKDASGSFLPVLGITLLNSVLAIGVIYVLGSRYIGSVSHVFAHRRQPEVFVALTLLVTLGIAWLTAAAGLSLALGTFLAGVLMGLFFMSVGMGIDINQIVQHSALILLSALGLILIKVLMVGGLFRVGGLRFGEAVERGLLLSQGVSLLSSSSALRCRSASCRPRPRSAGC